ncbi:hypothetical protein PF005_g4095 [Phytophthora fragariae]|uniref:Carbamoyl phosphate synthase preATP-grasp domain-containing protein n=1 Tax=Phytophthora fragariae TaxID=53985 RepID=A0A6A3TJA4_9STRA|nr:hypothetical protein PF009_g4597 [Phytophthora fragariae]KAE9068679.1 hypothetical protein PF010_g26973 [Phytophthora fragariae]KAE9082910.1 hypothetical protein PF006_g26798 [Phytophthora fragariae]KAE9131556.1 hypothetical protein PF007_g4083 [Phytophthora fragariae]KAE9228906.1 hypothetical protein PF005_g4095 [Phytophthora fragariae]
MPTENQAWRLQPTRNQVQRLLPTTNQALRLLLTTNQVRRLLPTANQGQYSGSQAITISREESGHAILVSSNIAMVQTSKGLADKVYFVPVRAKAVLKIIKKVKPDGILIDSIIDTEDRDKLSAKLDEIG